MEHLSEHKVGDVKVEKGIKTTVTDIDSKTGAVSWDVEYAADYLKLYQQVQQLFKTVETAARQSNAEPFIRDWGKDVRELRNSLRTYLRNNKFEEYNRVKNVNETNSTGGTSGTTSGTGIALGLGPKASEDGVRDNAYVKQYNYKLVDKKALNKKAKGIEVKQLWGK